MFHRLVSDHGLWLECSRQSQPRRAGGPNTSTRSSRGSSGTASEPSRAQRKRNVSRFFVAGGAGFIGSHLVARLLKRPDARLVVYDNFSSGRTWPLPNDRRLTVVSSDIKDLGALTEAIAGSDTVFHFA